MSMKDDRKAANKRLQKREQGLQKQAEKIYGAAGKDLQGRISGVLGPLADEDGKVEYRRLNEQADKAVQDQVLSEAAELAPAHPELIADKSRLTNSEAIQGHCLITSARAADKAEEVLKGHLLRTAMDELRLYASKTDEANLNVHDAGLELAMRGWMTQGPWYKTLRDRGQYYAKKAGDDLVAGIAQGRTLQDLTEGICKRFQITQQFSVYRIAYTENTRIQGDAAAMAAEQMGIMQYRLSTVGDGKVCDTCQAISEQVFDFADRAQGVNYPPLHPMCRCSVQYIVPDDFVAKYEGSGLLW